MSDLESTFGGVFWKEVVFLISRQNSLDCGWNRAFVWRLSPLLSSACGPESDLPEQGLDPHSNMQKKLSFLLVAHCHSRGCPQYEPFEEGRVPPGNEFIFLVINSKLLYSGNAVPLIEQAR